MKESIKIIIAQRASLTDRVRQKNMRQVFLAICLLFAGCAAPVNSSLWQPLPKKIVLSQPLSFEVRAVGRVTLPAGEYLMVHENRFGYFYGVSDNIKLDQNRVIGTPKGEVFSGGVALSNRESSVIVYELTVPNGMPGELGYFAAAEAGDKDGRFWRMRGKVPETVVPSFRMER